MISYYKEMWKIEYDIDCILNRYLCLYTLYLRNSESKKRIRMMKCIDIKNNGWKLLRG